MSEHPPVSPPTRPREAGTDADAVTPPVTVRLTKSTADGDPTLGVLYEADASIEFPSVTAAYAFEDGLNRAADRHEHQLTPDHRSDATFFLRRQCVDR